MLKFSDAARRAQPVGYLHSLSSYRSDKEVSDMRPGSIHPSERKRKPFMLSGTLSLGTAYPESFCKPLDKRLGSVQRRKRDLDGWRLWTVKKFSFWCLFCSLLA